jgi:galactokinase
LGATCFFAASIFQLQPVMIKQLIEKYDLYFEGQPYVFRAPGRVNIIGEHTDYNDGFVLPAAIDKYIYVAINKRADREIHLFAADYNAFYKTDWSHLEPTTLHWPNYILGIAAQLCRKNNNLSGFNICIDGNIPIGAGLSSSAALGSAAIFALNAIFETGFSLMEMAFMVQQAEHEYAGVKCGIMDPFASLFGKKDQAIKLDCRSLQYAYIPIAMPGYQWLLINSNVKHNLASSAYNERRRQCEEAVSILQKRFNQVKSLRDVNLHQLNQVAHEMETTVYLRSKYIIEEIHRVSEACVQLAAGNAAGVGALMFETHSGLSKDYEVSCIELDFLVDEARYFPGVAGSRMMGGGFGGCTLNLVKDEQVAALEAHVKGSYQAAFGKEAYGYLVETSDGAAAVPF